MNIFVPLTDGGKESVDNINTVIETQRVLSECAMIED